MKYISSMLFVMCICEYAFLAAPSDRKIELKLTESREGFPFFNR